MPPSVATLPPATNHGSMHQSMPLPGIGQRLAPNESQFGLLDYGMSSMNDSLDYASYQQQMGEDGQCRQMDANVSYWNLTCDSPLDYALPLYGYCMPFLLIITIISNTLIVLVLSKKSMATPTNFVLMGMAICDMLTVIFPAPGLWYMYTFGNHYKPLHPVSMCLAYSIFNEIMPAMCHTISVWLTLALAVQRYILRCARPHGPHLVHYAAGEALHECTSHCWRSLHQLPRILRPHLSAPFRSSGTETRRRCVTWRRRCGCTSTSAWTCTTRATTCSGCCSCTCCRASSW
ncbi:GL16438 [Drosophila persimilis]|uniref:GL16438 n=1 Tax=Drosophila persimilis TaxID=7234 RepID=B4GWI0_DROPE|nr:GL16438 [Drosophila persimilis]